MTKRQEEVKELIIEAAVRLRLNEKNMRDRGVKLFPVTPYGCEETSEHAGFLFAIEGTPIRMAGFAHRKIKYMKQGEVGGWQIITQHGTVFLRDKEQVPMPLKAV